MTTSGDLRDVRRQMLAQLGEQESLGIQDVGQPVIDRWPPGAKSSYAQSLPDPIAYFKPTRIDSLQQILAYCSANDLAVVPVGGASNVVGALLTSKPAVYVAVLGLNRIHSIDEVNCLVHCEAGIIGADLEASLEKKGLTLGHYPQSLHLSTIGGWIATRAMGTFSGRYGGIEDSVLAVKVVLADGSIVETQAAPRVIGPTLAHMFIGAEGTFGVVAEVTLRVYRRPAATKIGAWLLPDLRRGLATVREVVHQDLHPALMRLYDRQNGSSLTVDGHLNSDEAVPILIALSGAETVVAAQFDAVGSLIAGAGGQPAHELAAKWFDTRYRMPSFLARGTEQGFIGDAIDVVVWWSQVESAYHTIRQVILDAGASSCQAHFSHFYGQGVSIYFVLQVEVDDDLEALRRHARIWKAVMTECQQQGLGIAHHHGIGLARAYWYSATSSSSNVLLERLRNAMDPRRILNPDRFSPGKSPFG